MNFYRITLTCKTLQSDLQAHSTHWVLRNSAEVENFMESGPEYVRSVTWCALPGTEWLEQWEQQKGQKTRSLPRVHMMDTAVNELRRFGVLEEGTFSVRQTDLAYQRLCHLFGNVDRLEVEHGRVLSEAKETTEWTKEDERKATALHAMACGIITDLLKGWNVNSHFAFGAELVAYSGLPPTQRDQTFFMRDRPRRCSYNTGPYTQFDLALDEDVLRYIRDVGESWKPGEYATMSLVLLDCSREQLQSIQRRNARVSRRWPTGHVSLSITGRAADKDDYPVPVDMLTDRNFRAWARAPPEIAEMMESG